MAVYKLVVQALYKEADTLTDPSLLVMGLGVTELELQAVVDTLELLMMPGMAGEWLMKFNIQTE